MTTKERATYSSMETSTQEDWDIIKQYPPRDAGASGAGLRLPDGHAEADGVLGRRWAGERP